MSVIVVPWNLPRKTTHCQKPNDSRCYFPSCRPGGPWGKAWFHPAKELKVYCTINPYKANNLKGFKPLCARISWSVVGASVLVPAGVGSLSFSPSSCILGLWCSLLFSAPQSLADISPPSLCLHHPSSPLLPSGASRSCPVGLGVLSDGGTWVFPKILCCCCPLDWRS